MVLPSPQANICDGVVRNSGEQATPSRPLSSTRLGLCTVIQPGQISPTGIGFEATGKVIEAV